jgi:diketogulonate reductase-like aldo/keto reductase
MREIGRAHDSKSPVQVALNWVVCKGAVPIPGVKNLKQAQENIGALGWQLTPEEISLLDLASDQIST